MRWILVLLYVLGVLMSRVAMSSEDCGSKMGVVRCQIALFTMSLLWPVIATSEIAYRSTTVFMVELGNREHR